MKILFTVERLVSYFLYFTGIYWLRKKRLEKGTGVVLVYHRVLSGKRRHGEMVGERAFDWQMRYLKRSCSPFDCEKDGDTARSCEGLRVMVTFDDGYRDNFTRAIPIMEKHGVPGVFFVTTDLVFGGKHLESGGEKVEDESIPAREDLETAKRAAGITFGNHTASHRIVSGMGVYDLDRELMESQELLREFLGETPDMFAYPRGRSEDVTEKAFPILEKHRIKTAFTMIPGFVTKKTHPFMVPRIGMSHVNDRIVFKVKMLGLLNPLVRIKNRAGA
jgi:peptidoglycan/xylan/chitin deacetylase (PgdA/CDA1 family)